MAHTVFSDSCTTCFELQNFCFSVLLCAVQGLASPHNGKANMSIFSPYHVSDPNLSFSRAQSTAAGGSESVIYFYFCRAYTLFIRGNQHAAKHSFGTGLSGSPAIFVSCLCFGGIGQEKVDGNRRNGRIGEKRFFKLSKFQK